MTDVSLMTITIAQALVDFAGLAQNLPRRKRTRECCGASAIGERQWAATLLNGLLDSALTALPETEAQQSLA